MALPHIRTDDYDYALPEERIALHPLEERTAARLLVPGKNEIRDAFIRDLPTILPEHAAVFVNDTRVVHARLIFPNVPRPIEVFCLSASDGRSLDHILHHRYKASLLAMVGGARRWKSGALSMEWKVGVETIILQAERGERTSTGAFVVQLSWNSAHSLAEILQEAGHVPLPPYINRPDEEGDDERYQTVYAENQGSVAAPTAGLHFDQKLMDELRAKGHTFHELTLHVGAGTFKPISSQLAEEHIMHGEEIVVASAMLEKIKDCAGRCIAVGTTSMRTLESLYWLGVKAAIEGKLAPYLLQNDAYQLPQEYSLEQAMDALIHQLKEREVDTLRCTTQLYIMPGYQFRLVDFLLTNFHQPRSTLLLLIAAFYGPDWRDLYAHALKGDYRFLSYGDAMFLKRQR